MSKSFNMAGWRVGFCLGNPQDDRGAGAHQELSGLRRFPAHSDRLDHRAARMRRRDEKDLRDVYQKRRDVLISGLSAPVGRWSRRAGPMFVWAPIPEQYRATGSLEFSKLLMEKALVAVSPGIGFGPLGEGTSGSRWWRTNIESRQASQIDPAVLEKDKCRARLRAHRGSIRDKAGWPRCGRADRKSPARIAPATPRARRIRGPRTLGRSCRAAMAAASSTG